jgi:hypothetical protein
MVSDDRDKRDDEAARRSDDDAGREQEDHGELRFEGPISLDDEEFEDEDGASGGGRTFLLTAIIAVAVVLIVVIALMLRESAGPEPGELAEHGIPSGSSEGPESTGALGSAGDATADVSGEDLEFRSVPSDEPMASAEGSAPDPGGPSTVPEESRATAEPEPVEPAPAPEPEPREEARRAERAPERPASEEVRPGRVAELARAGDVTAAAQLGRRLAASGNPSHFTLQVLLACNPDNVQRAFEEVRDGRLTVLPAEYQGRSCYRLCWGSYADAAAARAAVGSVPGHFTNEPVPRPWGDLLR